MNTHITSLSILALSLVLIGGGCFSATSSDYPSGDPMNDPATSIIVDEEITETESASDAASQLPPRTDVEPGTVGAVGLALPEGAYDLTEIDGEEGAGTLGYTDLSLEETKSYFQVEISLEGYNISRPWGAAPTDNDSRMSASFSRNGELLGIVITDEGDRRKFDLQVQY